MKRLALGLAAACALALAGCGNTTSHAAPPASATPAAAAGCAHNQAYMGCAKLHAAALARPTAVPVPSGLLFPDVSSWQGAVNWQAVAAWQRAHGWHPTAIFKMGEYTLDPQATRNAQQTKALGFWRAGYWFVRNTGCAHEAGLIKWAASMFGLKVVVLDTEVPEARGYVSCLAPPLRAAGFIVLTYSSPGSYPGGDSANTSVWVAAFGPAHPPCLFTCNVGLLNKQSILAWQFTDGTFGPVVTIPGIGHDDVNVSYGIERLGAAPAPKPKPVLPVCIHHRESKAACAAVKAKVASDLRAVASSQRALAGVNATLTANHCVKPYRRGVCRKGGRGVRLFSQRVRYFTAKAAELQAAN